MSEYSTIHRYLDEAFAGAAMNGEIQDLKEEIRGNLTARVAELEQGGADAAAATTTAIRELGDIRELIDSLGPQADRESYLELMTRNHVRPRPAFVVRTVALSLVLAAGIALLVLAALHVLAWPIAVQALVALVGVALPAGVIVTDALHQETSLHYPVPRGRAIAYGLAAFVGGLGLSLVGIYFGSMSEVWLVIVGALLVVAAIIGFTWLGVTQTNRTKPWALAMQRDASAEDRFTQDPAAAARFGIYTIVIWTVAIVLFFVLSFTIGFAWSWLAIVGGFLVFFLTLARMLFPAEKQK